MASYSFSNDYDIYEENGVIVGQQFQTLSGPCDTLAISKDKKEFLVIEMKKGRANDQVIGQITRYMGVIKDTLAANGQNVRGCIIAYEHNQNLKYALSMVPNLDCYAYRLKFDLEKIEAAS